MQLLFLLIADAAWKAGIIQENIFRNRNLKDDPYSAKWHWWQGFQYVAVVAMLLVIDWRYGLYELPLTVIFWILFNGLNNTRTFGRPWLFVPPIRHVGDRVIYAGSAMDRWLQKRKHPERTLMRAQIIALISSFLPLIIYLSFYNT